LLNATMFSNNADPRPTHRCGSYQEPGNIVRNTQCSTLQS
jgi:hypothetical protein